jgi:hypothetical protein
MFIPDFKELRNNFPSGIRDEKNSDPASRINIPDQ